MRTLTGRPSVVKAGPAAATVGRTRRMPVPTKVGLTHLLVLLSLLRGGVPKPHRHVFAKRGLVLAGVVQKTHPGARILTATSPLAKKVVAIYDTLALRHKA